MRVVSEYRIRVGVSEDTWSKLNDDDLDHLNDIIEDASYKLEAILEDTLRGTKVAGMPVNLLVEMD